MCFPGELCDGFVLFFRLGLASNGQYTLSQVLDISQNKSGDEEDISGDEFDENDEVYVGESESSDQDSSHSSEEEPEDNNPDGSESDNATAGPPPKRQRNRKTAVGKT